MSTQVVKLINFRQTRAILSVLYIWNHSLLFVKVDAYLPASCEATLLNMSAMNPVLRLEDAIPWRLLGLLAYRAKEVSLISLNNCFLPLANKFLRKIYNLRKCAQGLTRLENLWYIPRDSNWVSPRVYVESLSCPMRSRPIKTLRIRPCWETIRAPSFFID